MSNPALSSSRTWASLAPRDDVGKLARVVGERTHGNVEAMEHREEKIAEGSLVLLLDEAAVAQAEVSAACEDCGIVAGVVSGAGAATIEGHGVVEQPIVAFAD